MEYRVQNPDAVFSPGLLFYAGVIARNIERAIALVGDVARLRPHVKTHKTREITRMLLQAGVRKFKCATIAEAEMLGECEAPDVLIAYPLVGPNMERLVHLMKRFPVTTFGSLVDHTEMAARLSQIMSREGLVASVFLDLDVGMHRTGIAPGEPALRLYEQLEKLPGLRPSGIHAYDGHNTQPDMAKRQFTAKKVLDAVHELREAMLAKGMDVLSVIAGGTPPLSLYAREQCLDVSPGTCFLQDGSYMSKYQELSFEPAALVLARVISRPTRRVVCLDVGYKSICADPPMHERGTILGVSDVNWILQNEEHWVFESNVADELRVGEEVYVLPRHICPTVALHDFAYVVDEKGYCVDRWEIRARRRAITI